ncbi:MAG: hypothetical protein ACXAEN_18900 [Candidatus Thorarchaeota archaeon]|jgi:hypothetical protein
MPSFETAGPIRDLVLVLDTGIILYSGLFAILLLGRWFRAPRRSLVDIRLAWAVFLIGVVANSLSFVMGDFYFQLEPLKTIWTKAGYLALILALVAFFAAIEQIIPQRTRHVLVVSGLTMAAITVISPPELLVPIAVSGAFVALVGTLLFFDYSRKNTSGAVRSSVNQLIVGFLVGFVGFLGRSDTVYYNLGEEVYVLGAVMLFVGLAVFGHALATSTALDELDWMKQIVRLYVIQEGGILVFYHEFAEPQQADEFLAAAGISGIQTLMMEITRSQEGLNTLSVGEFEISFAHGRSFTSVLVSRKQYSILIEKIRLFTEDFQQVYGRILPNFSGDIRLFGAAREIIESVF